MKNMRLLIVVFASLWLFACASVPMADSAEDARLKQFPRPPEGMSAVYIYRDTFVNNGLRSVLKIDGATIGETVNKVYLYAVIPPGHHVFETESYMNDLPFTLNTEAGKTYFLKYDLELSLMVTDSKLVEVSAEEGKAGVKACQLGKLF